MLGKASTRDRANGNDTKREFSEGSGVTNKAVDDDAGPTRCNGNGCQVVANQSHRQRSPVDHEHPTVACSPERGSDKRVVLENANGFYDAGKRELPETDKPGSNDL